MTFIGQELHHISTNISTPVLTAGKDQAHRIETREEGKTSWSIIIADNSHLTQLRGTYLHLIDLSMTSLAVDRLSLNASSPGIRCGKASVDPVPWKIRARTTKRIHLSRRDGMLHKVLDGRKANDRRDNPLRRRMKRLAKTRTLRPCHLGMLRSISPQLTSMEVRFAHLASHATKGSRSISAPKAPNLRG
jgi:hypothetical protein